MSPYELTALQACDKARQAYEIAKADPNPYAEAAVTQRLAEGGLILLSTARRVLNEE